MVPAPGNNRSGDQGGLSMAVRLTPRLALLVLMAGVALLAPCRGTALAQDGDWPCVQRLVPRLESGQMWPGPPIDAIADAQPSVAVSTLAVELSDLSLTDAELASRVQAFAASLAPESRETELVHLFAATLEEINRTRAGLIEGIRRYARGQQQLAQRIARENRALDEERTAGADPVRLAELQASREWATRVHLDRQRQLTLVCDQPVRLEQRAFALARLIQEQLP